MVSFDDDFAAVDAMLAEVFGCTVSIHRNTASTTGVTAEAVIRDYEIDEQEGFAATIQSRDFVIDVSDYRIEATAVQPRSGDRIKETIGGVVHVFEVMPLGSRPCVEWIGNSKAQWLIHTKLVGTE